MVTTFKFIASLLHFPTGWRANHARRTRLLRPGCNPTPSLRRLAEFVSLGHMRSVLSICGILGCLLMCSCATGRSIHRRLPADVTINKDAGRGSWLLLMLRLKDGEAMPFVIDTGTSDTFLNKSLEPRLGKRRGTTIFPHWGVNHEAGAYAAPELYLGDTPLKQAGRFVFTADMLPKARSGPPIMGVLGMDCLKHYCIQLDFDAGEMRFLDPGQVDTAALGKAFPLTFTRNRPFIQHSGLLGGSSTNLLIDSGFDGDGGLASRAFREFLDEKESGAGKGVKDLGSGWMFVPEVVWDGATYTNLTVGEGGNLIGLRFLARHLVTLNFPKRTMYLKH
jgi:hypothetical protein